jgi:hypothetical protein
MRELGIRDKVQDGSVILGYVNYAHQLADVLKNPWGKKSLFL